MTKVLFDIPTEIENIKREYKLENEDIVLALQSAFSKTLGREVLVATDENEKHLKIVRVNIDGTLSPVTYKAFKKGKKELSKELELRAKLKSNDRLFSLFSKGEIVKGRIFDVTKNGCFVVVKGERAFFPFVNGYEKEKFNALYQIDNTLSFKVLNITDNRIVLSRRSLRIIAENICDLIGRNLSLKKRHDGSLAVYCCEPFLDEAQMELIRATLPIKIVFKKEKKI